MKESLESIVRDYHNIHDFKEILGDKRIENRVYEYIYSFNLKVEDFNISMMMGIPKDWDRKLIDIYIREYNNIPYIPHVETDGKMCLFDLEGVLIEKDFRGLLNQSILRMEEILYNGITGKNKEDFIKEFTAYWARLPRYKILKSMIDLTDDIKIVKYSDNKYIPQKQKSKKKFIDRLKLNSNYEFIVSDNEKNLTNYHNINAIRNAVYIKINADNYIYPPDWRNELNVDYINMLLNLEDIDNEKLLKCIEKCKNNLLLIFNIEQMGEYSSVFGVMIEKYIICNENNKIRITSDNKLIPCSAIRCDKSFLMSRGGADLALKNKKLLVIGCGSIGGYLINELVKAGFDRIVVVDSDKMKEENIYRHYLGLQYVGKYKGKAISDYMNKNIPNINIVSVESDIEDSIEDGSIEFKEYDLIISAVGNHNVNRWINDYIHKEYIEVPVIYLWNEVLGIGNHGAFIALRNNGCYECLFRHDDNDELYDGSSYCAKGQKFTKDIIGCGTSYMPYGSTTSLKTAILGVEMSVNYFREEYQKNYLISIKGSDYYFKSFDYKTSNRYEMQETIREKLNGDQFEKEDCIYCRGN